MKQSTTKLLDDERKKQIYQTKNLDKHIDKFLDIQIKNTTRENYLIAVNDFKKYLIKNDIKELRADNYKTVLQEYKSYLLSRDKYASSSIDNYLLRVQSFYSYLNFNVKLKKLNSNKTNTYKYLSIAEIKQLLKAIAEATNNEEIIKRDTAIICLLFSAGLRINELLNLKKEDFLKEQNSYFVIITGKGRATDEKEKIAIPEATAGYIIDYLTLLPATTDDYLFRSINNKQLSRQAVNKNLKRYAKASDEMFNTDILKRCSTHCFRHSLARYLLIDKQIAISQVKDILRHSNIETTAKYLTNSDDEIKEIRESIEF